MEEKKAVTITVKVEDEKKKEDETPIGEHPFEPEDPAIKDKAGAEELSEEDRALMEGLETAVLRTKDADMGVVALALEHLRREIRSSTTSMTSVPKPLKFLRPHYATLKGVYDSLVATEQQSVRRELADILSVLAMTMAASDSRESLSFKLQGNVSDLGAWGHEYVRSLAGEIGREYASRVNETIDAVDTASPDCADLMHLVADIVPFHLQHNAEAEAIDLLIEVQQLRLLLSDSHLSLIDESNYERICLYLLRCADFMSDPDDLQVCVRVSRA
jgi:26S proteasome regulatory subunit N1